MFEDTLAMGYYLTPDQDQSLQEVPSGLECVSQGMLRSTSPPALISNVAHTCQQTSARTCLVSTALLVL